MIITIKDLNIEVTFSSFTTVEREIMVKILLYIIQCILILSCLYFLHTKALMLLMSQEDALITPGGM